MADTPRVVLGVDPGSQRTGWGIIAEQSGVLRLVDCGIIRTTSSGEKEFSQRLAVIYRQLADVVGRYRPQAECKLPYGFRRVGPRKMNIASLIVMPSSSMVRRSMPRPKPPCGGQPYLKNSV